MIWLVLGSVFVFGLLIGSFLNVCIYRMPRGESIIRPRSRCPGCKQQLRWYENLPLLSYVFLRGRCRYCRHAISLRYPTVEFLSALLAVAIWIRSPDPVTFLCYFLLLSAPLLVITFIDLEHLLIPDVITLPGIVIGVAVHAYLSPAPWSIALIESGLGILVGGGSLWLISWIYERWRGRIGLGMGDVKLAAMLGAFLGWRSIIFILFVSSFVGMLVGFVLLLSRQRRLKQPLPYGPFLALAAWIYLFAGTPILRWYLGFAAGLFRH